MDISVIKVQVPINWNNLTDWLLDKGNRRGAKRNIIRAMLAAGVHKVWQERNERVFTIQRRSAEIIGKQIIQPLHIRTMGSSKKVTH